MPAPTPFRPVAEALIGAIAEQHTPELVAMTYANMIEAIVHPHNVEALRIVRGIAAFAEPIEGAHPVASMIASDVAKVLDYLGVPPLDYERDVKPNLDEEEERLLSEAEAIVGEHVLRAMAEHGPVEGRPN
jgi:hypothetical protein